MTDLERIRVIEETFGIEMQRVPLGELLSAYEIEHHEYSFINGTCSYSLDENQRLIGLSLFDVDFKRLSSDLLEPCEKLEQLSLTYTEILNCGFLRTLTSLNTLILSSNGLKDISVLSKLTSLNTLILSSNGLKDISVLSKLTSLNTLNLSSNGLKDISVLSKLTSLNTLILSSNGLKDISVLSKLTSLNTLILSSNGLKDISVLSKLTSLKGLDLSYNEIKDISVLSKLTSLNTLNLSFNGLKDISVLSKLTSLKELNLSYNGLTDISALNKLTSLKELDLENNGLTDISVLSKLTSLNTLNLSFNGLKDISVLSKLTSLNTLNLWLNKIEDISVLSKLTSLKELYLSSNEIKDISVLSKLTSLKGLDLSSNEIKDISVLSKLTSLNTLNLWHNKVEDISVLSKLTSLNTLNLSSNEIKDISVLSKLTSLKELYLSSNEIKDISVLSKLTSLNTLNLWHNKVEDISVLSKLTSLNTLNLSSNGLKDISVLSKLTSLNTLILSSNGLKDISVLSKLTSLNTLYLSSNEIKDISVLSKLTSLNTLILSSNGLKDISVLSKLTSLNTLNLSSNGLKDISVLSKLTSLNTLNLSSNGLKDISVLSKLTSLKELNLSSNEIKDINCFKHWGGGQLFLFNNPISHIEKEIFGNSSRYNCRRSLQDYWLAIEKYGETKNLQFKVLLLGNGRVGKSSVADRLLGNGFDSERASTHAIYLEKWPLDYNDNPLDIRIWDFGGQDIYHGTHRLFMRNKTLYLLVWDAVSEYKKANADPKGDKYRNFRLHYWLDYIKRFSPDSQIIIVQNKAGEKEDNDKRAPDEIEKLKDTYNIADYISLSSKKGGEEIDELIRKIKKTIPKMTDCLRMIPKPWDAVRKRIEEIAKSQNTISYQEYQGICKEEHISEISDTSENSLLEFLHNTGTVYRNSNLSDEIILNQQWAIEAIYTLFDRNEAYHQLLGKGKFTRKDLAMVAWKDHPKETQEVFLSFMESAELCFRLNERSNKETTYIAPQLLPEMSVENCNRRKGRYTSALYLQYRHQFYHEGVMFRFIARLGKMIEDNDNFRNRNFLEIEDDKGNRAYIEKLPQNSTDGNDLSGTIEIGVSGKTPKDFLDRIRNEFEKMTDGASIEVYVSVNGTDYPKIEDVKKHFEKNIPMLSPQENVIDPADFQPFFSKSTDDSLTEQKEKHTHEGKETQPPKYKAMPNEEQHIYFSYAWKNDDHPDIERLVNEVYDSLKKDYSLKRDKMDLGYQGIISEFMNEIGEGKLVVVGLSKKYLYSEYCMNELHKMYLDAQGKIENFAKQALPIWVEQLNINDISFKRELFTHWKSKEQEMQDYISDFPDMISPQEHKQLDMIRQAKQNISTLLAFVSDINALNPELLAKDDFAKMKETIEKRLN